MPGALAQKKGAEAAPVPQLQPYPARPVEAPTTRALLAETVETFEAWLHEMQALGQPPTGLAAWADLVAAVENHVRIAAEQEAAAHRSDVETFVRDYHEGTKTQDELLRAAYAAGVPECADVDR